MITIKLCTLLKNHWNLINGLGNWKICAQKQKFLIRVQKLEQDENFGECKPVGNGIQELKINYEKAIEFTSKKKTEK